jgi:geranylgeranyl diphosphate synthase type II
MPQSYNSVVALIDKKINESEIFPENPRSLYDPCKYIVSLGGKRVRPAVCLMANELFGEIKEEAWNAAIAIELFHNFTLIHDDIMDKAPLRRGFPTVHAKYGLTAGILGGDAMSIYAYQSLSKVNTNFKKVLDVFNTTAIEVCDGQQMDMDFEVASNVTKKDYIDMITLKTSVLLAASLKIGALIANAPLQDCEKLYEFGKNLGIAYQLQDDYLDAFGTVKKLGKQKGGDIIANKKTYLYLDALEKASPEQYETFMKWESAKDSSAKVTEVLELFNTLGVGDACKLAIHNYADLAFKCLSAVELSDEIKLPLQQLALDLLNRES